MKMFKLFPINFQDSNFEKLDGVLKRLFYHKRLEIVFVGTTPHYIGGTVGTLPTEIVSVGKTLGLHWLGGTEISSA